MGADHPSVTRFETGAWSRPPNNAAVALRRGSAIGATVAMALRPDGGRGCRPRSSPSREAYVYTRMRVLPRGERAHTERLSCPVVYDGGAAA